MNCLICWSVFWGDDASRWFLNIYLTLLSRTVYLCYQLRLSIISSAFKISWPAFFFIVFFSFCFFFFLFFFLRVLQSFKYYCEVTTLLPVKLAITLEMNYQIQIFVVLIQFQTESNTEPVSLTKKMRPANFIHGILPLGLHSRILFSEPYKKITVYIYIYIYIYIYTWVMSTKWGARGN